MNDRDENVSQSMYKDTLPEGQTNDELEPQTNGVAHDGNAPKYQIPHPAGSKVNRICDAFLDALQGHTADHLRNMVSAHVCKNPPDLEAGLRMIADLRSEYYLTQLSVQSLIDPQSMTSTSQRRQLSISVSSLMSIVYTTSP